LRRPPHAESGERLASLENLKRIGKRTGVFEVRLANHDNAIAATNNIYSARWKKMEALESSEVPANQKPPHY
jgi:hypothetical protein